MLFYYYFQNILWLKAITEKRFFAALYGLYIGILRALMNTKYQNIIYLVRGSKIVNTFLKYVQFDAHVKLVFF